MLCSKCSVPVGDDSKFCTNCGEPNPNYSDVKTGADSAEASSGVAESMTNSGVEPVGGASANSTHFADFREEKPKKKFPMGLIIGGVAAVAVAGGAVAAVGMIGGGNPTDQFKKIVTDYTGKQNNSFSKFYRQYLADAREMSEGAFESSLLLELHDSGLKDTLSSFAMLGSGVNIDWLNSIEIKGVGNVAEKEMAADMEFLVNGKNAFNTNFYFGETQYLMQFPDLSEDYLDLTSAIESQMDMSTLLAAQGKYIDSLPDADTLETLMNKYSLIWLEEIKDVKSEKSEVTAEGVTQNATKLSAVLEGDQVKAVYKKYLETIQSDKDLEKVVVSYIDGTQSMMGMMGVPGANNMGGDWSYDSFLEDVKTELGEIESRDFSDVKLGIDIWADGNNFVAYELNMESDDSKSTVGFKVPRKGKDIGIEYKVEADPDVFVLKGTAKYDAGNLSGEFQIHGKDEHLMNLKLTKLDYNALEKGRLVLEAELSLVGNTSLTQSIGMNVENYSLAILADSTAKDTNASLVIREGGKDSITLKTVGKFLGKKAIEVPSGTVVDISDEQTATAYFQNANWDGWLEKLRNTDIPSEYIDVISGLSQMYR